MPSTASSSSRTSTGRSSRTNPNGTATGECRGRTTTRPPTPWSSGAATTAFRSGATASSGSPRSGSRRWVTQLDAEQLKAAVEHRMDSAVKHFRGAFVHWDVDNEMLHGSFFKDRLGEDIHAWMYKRARELDPNVKLFANEFNILSVDEDFKEVQTDEYVADIRRLRSRGPDRRRRHPGPHLVRGYPRASGGHPAAARQGGRPETADLDQRVRRGRRGREGPTPTSWNWSTARPTAIRRSRAS